MDDFANEYLGNILLMMGSDYHKFLQTHIVVFMEVHVVCMCTVMPFLIIIENMDNFLYSHYKNPFRPYC